MSNSYRLPQITTAEDESGDWVLIAHGHGAPAVCGERILRAEPWPEPPIRWSTPTEQEAEAEAGRLRAYLGLYTGGKLKDVENAPRRRGWWED